MTLKINVVNLRERLLWLITLIMFSSLYIFSTYSWGKYILVLGSTIIFIIGILLNTGISSKYCLKIYHIIQCLLIIYCLFSCVWSIDTSASLVKTYQLVQYLLFFSMLFAYFSKINSINPLLDIIMWAGYALSIYTLIYYGGVSAVMTKLANAQRLENAFCNVNLIGMLCALACLIQLYKILYYKSFWTVFFSLPTIIVLAACQSRKSILILFLGIIAVIILKNANRKNLIVSIFKITISLVIVLFLLRFILNLDIFAGMKHRIELLFADFGFSAQGHSTNSSGSVRLNFIDIGLNYFFKRPILGYGFGSSQIILEKEVGYATYFHNNFVELLVSGGIIGFTFYYSNYVYLFYNFIKLRKYSEKETDISFIILLILFILDYGMVSYIEKIQYFYFMICYIQLEILKRERNKHIYESFKNLQKNFKIS